MLLVAEGLLPVVHDPVVSLPWVGPGLVGVVRLPHPPVSFGVTVVTGLWWLRRRRRPRVKRRDA
jgi:hypothetical protein